MSGPTETPQAAPPRPYPDALAPAGRRAALADLHREGRELRRPSPDPIPPAERVVLAGHDAKCATCESFTRRGGACLGVKPGPRTPGSPIWRPACHSEEQAARAAVLERLR